MLRAFPVALCYVLTLPTVTGNLPWADICTVGRTGAVNQFSDFFTCHRVIDCIQPPLRMSLESIITTYGYPALFFGVILEAEGFLILGAYLAHRGYFSLPVVIGVAVLASFSATELFFYMGRRYGLALLEKRPGWQKNIARIHTWFTKYGDGLVLGYRALYGMRLVIPVTIGTSAYSRGRYTFFNAIGALAWGLLIGLAGNGIAQFVEQFFAHLRRHELLVVLVLAGLAATWGLIQWNRRRKVLVPPKA